MKAYGRWIILGAVLTVVLILTAWASSQTPMKPRASEMWSRGKIIGQTPQKRHVALQFAPDEGAFLVWQNMEERLELAHIGVDGEVLLNHALPIEGKEPRDPQLYVGADGLLHLLWREGKHPQSTIYYALLNTDGTLASRPRPISDPENPVLDAPQMVLDTEGRHHAIWSDRAGIQWAVFDAGGILLKGPVLVSRAGRFPAVRTDDQGRLHVVWHQRIRAHLEGVYYAALDPMRGVASEPEEITQATLRTGQTLQEPSIGLTSDTVYVFWWIQDFKYVYSWGEYASFPLALPQQKQIEPLPLRQAQDPIETYPLNSQQPPMLVALSAGIRDPGSAGASRTQIAVIVLGDERAEEQIVTASVQASIKPVIIADDRSNLHLAWLETSEFGEYQVVYASTAPEVMNNYNATTTLDVLDTVFSNVFRLSTLIVALIAVLIMWALIPLLGVLFYHLATSEETLQARRTQIVLIVVLGLHVILTFAIPPKIGIEASWEGLRWVAPAISGIVTTLTTLYVMRRQEQQAHLFGVYFLFVSMNSILQMVMYFLI